MLIPYVSLVSFQAPAYFWFRCSAGQPLLKQSYWRDGPLTDDEKNTPKIHCHMFVFTQTFKSFAKTAE